MLFSLSKQDPVILVVDGHGSHFMVEVLEFCIKNSIHLVLSPPHTSHVSQGEDVIIFKALKKLLCCAVGQRLSSKVLETLQGGRIQVQACTLMNHELMDCIRTPWTYGFQEAHCLTQGTLPHSRHGR